MRPLKRILLILADGARPDVLKELVAQGRLPEISRHLISQGTLTDACSVFPSATGPAYLPFLTGCYPGTCDLPGIRWFDKNRYAEKFFSLDRFRSYVGIESLLINQDLSPRVKTLFEIIPRSYTIFSPIGRGMRWTHNQTKFSRFGYWYYAHVTNRWDRVDRAAGRKALRALEEDPEFLFAVFPGIDEFSHVMSPFHSKTLEAYEELDRWMGRLVQKLKTKGIWEETGIFLVSDHGLSETQSHFPLDQFLEKKGLKNLYYPKVLFKQGCTVASMVSGNAMAHLYFKGPEGWKGRLSAEEVTALHPGLLEELLERPEIDLMAFQRQDGSVVVKSRRGEAVISVGAGHRACPDRGNHGGLPLHYTIIKSDPFGYPPLPPSMTDRESLALTWKTDYPDALVQLLQIFRSKRAGDLILSASKGYDLRAFHEHPEHKASHGSLHREHMMIPLISNLKLDQGPRRSVDLFPTILRALHRPISTQVDC